MTFGISDGRRHGVLHTLVFNIFCWKQRGKCPDIQSKEKLMFFYMVGAEYSTLVFNVFCEYKEANTQTSEEK